MSLIRSGNSTLFRLTAMASLSPKSRDEIWVPFQYALLGRLGSVRPLVEDAWWPDHIVTSFHTFFYFGCCFFNTRPQLFSCQPYIHNNNATTSTAATPRTTPTYDELCGQVSARTPSELPQILYQLNPMLGPVLQLFPLAAKHRRLLPPSGHEHVAWRTQRHSSFISAPLFWWMSRWWSLLSCQEWVQQNTTTCSPRVTASSATIWARTSPPARSWSSYAMILGFGTTAEDAWQTDHIVTPCLPILMASSNGWIIPFFPKLGFFYRRHVSGIKEVHKEFLLLCKYVLNWSQQCSLHTIHCVRTSFPSWVALQLNLGKRLWDCLKAILVFFHALTQLLPHSTFCFNHCPSCIPVGLPVSIICLQSLIH